MCRRCWIPCLILKTDEPADRALYTTHDMLSLLNDTLISAGDSLDAGTKATLQGMEKILDKN